MVYVQYNLRFRRNQLLSKTPGSQTIVLEDVDPSSDWVVESQPAAFDNEDLSWMDLDPLPQQEDVEIDVVVGLVPSGPGESSHAPVEDVDDDSESDHEDLNISDI